MQTGERYAYAIMMMLTLVLVHNCRILNCLYDIGACAFQPTWARYIAAHPELLIYFVMTAFALPAFHRYMHRARCQATWAWLYVAGAGVPGAETAEQGWSRAGLLEARLKGTGILRKHVILESWFDFWNEFKLVRKQELTPLTLNPKPPARHAPSDSGSPALALVLSLLRRPPLFGHAFPRHG